MYLFIVFFSFSGSLEANISMLSYNNKFKAMYLTTQDMVNSMVFWPEIVFIDGTYCLSDSDLVLMLVTVEDSNGKTNIVAVGLLTSEDLSTVDWFLKTFRRNHSQACSRIECFMSDKHMVGRRVLKEIFPGVRVYICLFHTLQAMKRGVHGLPLSKEDKDIWFEQLRKLTYSGSEEEYFERYKVFCIDAPARLLEYYNTNWHSIREDWTVYSMKYGNLMNLTNNRLESMNAKVKQVVPKRSTLLNLLKFLFKYIELQMCEVNQKAANNFTKIKTRVEKGTHEEQYMHLLTDFAFSYVSRQLQLSEKSQIDILSGTEFLIKKKYTIIKMTASSCECNDRISSKLPCRHIFAVRRALHLPLFDEKLCNVRWTNDYYGRTQRIFKPPNVEATVMPFMCEYELPKTNTAEGRLSIVRSIINCIERIVSESCGTSFDAKIGILKQILELWKMSFNVSVSEITMEAGSHDASHQTQLCHDMSQLDVNLKTGAKKKVLSVPQKRRQFVKPLTKEISDLVCSSDESRQFNQKHKT